MLRLSRNVFGETAVQLGVRGNNLSAVECRRVTLPVGDFTAGFLNQQQSGGDGPGVDEVVVVSLALNLGVYLYVLVFQ